LPHGHRSADRWITFAVVSESTAGQSKGFADVVEVEPAVISVGVPLDSPAYTDCMLVAVAVLWILH
jgi:hypothetical protein